MLPSLALGTSVLALSWAAGHPWLGALAGVVVAVLHFTVRLRRAVRETDDVHQTLAIARAQRGARANGLSDFMLPDEGRASIAPYLRAGDRYVDDGNIASSDYQWLGRLFVGTTHAYLWSGEMTQPLVIPIERILQVRVRGSVVPSFSTLTIRAVDEQGHAVNWNGPAGTLVAKSLARQYKAQSSKRS
jgi:hypothetical protein